MTFDEAVAHVLRFEGGYSFDKNDPGGETNFGISKRAYPAIEIQSLNMEAARALYRRDYWNALNIEQLPVAIRFLVFDAAVNQGPSAAFRMLQASVDVPPDGVVGLETLTALAAVDPLKLIQRYALARLKRYWSNPNIERYGQGWLARLIDVSIISASHLGVK